MAIQELKDKAKLLRIEADSLKTKKSKEKKYNAARELENQVFIQLCDQRDQIGQFSFKGIIKDFTGRCDEFLVETPYGLMWLSPTLDVLSKSWYTGTCCIEYTKGQTIYIDAIIEVNHDRLVLEIIPRKINGGTLNTDQYIELCKKDNLAFFKYPGGMSGLFR